MFWTGKDTNFTINLQPGRFIIENKQTNKQNFMLQCHVQHFHIEKWNEIFSIVEEIRKQ